MTGEHYVRQELTARTIDFAFIPYWYLTTDEGRRVVRDHIQPERIIVIHVPPAELDDIRREVSGHFENVVFFEESMESKRF